MEQAWLIERLERLERENVKFRRSATFMKLLVSSLIAITVAGISIPIAHSITFPGPVSASEFDLLGPGLRVTARLHTLRNGPNLTFYDNAGKVIVDVGFVNDATSTQAGMTVFDGNAGLAGNGVPRAAFGYTSRSSAGTGVGFVSYDGTGAIRTNIGQALNGSAAYDDLYDATGALRTGITVPTGALIGYFNQDPNGTSRVQLYESADGLVTSLSLKHQSGIEGSDAIANDESGEIGSNYAVWNADHSNLAAFVGVNEPNDFGIVDTLDGGTVTGHLP
jgi:hypothetical protein